MPPAKARLSATIDIPLMKYVEDRFNEQRREALNKGERLPSFSEYINGLIREWVEMDRRRARSPKAP